MNLTCKKTRRERSLGLMLALFLLGASAEVAAAQAPVHRTITIDGERDDWTEVLTSPLNAASDGEGSMPDCSLSTDLDCTPLRPEGSVDLQDLAWTADNSHLYFSFTTYGDFVEGAHFVLYLDTDFDGLMETGEPLLHVRMDEFGLDEGFLWLLTYVEDLPGGDPLLSLTAMADGHTLPGAMGGSETQAGEVDGKVDERFVEFSVSWSELGLGPNSPLNFHLASSLQFDPWPPGQVEDNMAGSLGGNGTTGYRSLSIDEGVSIGSAPSKTVLFRHLVTNDGNVPDRVRVESTSLQGFDIQTWQDDDEDGFPDTPLAADVDGDGVFNQPGDILHPAGDGDMDGLLDLGLLAAGESALLVFQQDLDAAAAGIEELSVAAWYLGDASVDDSAVDSIRIGEITLRNDEARLGAPSADVWFPHVLANNSLATGTFNLDLTSNEGWSFEFYSDPVGSGLPGDAGPLLEDSDGDGLPDLMLPPLTSAALFVKVAVPFEASIGTVDVLDLNVKLGGAVRDSVTDKITVAQHVTITPSHLLTDGTARYGGSGESIYFPHVIRNATGLADSYSVTMDCDLGWPVFLLDDQEADGLPYGSALLPGRTGVVPCNGGTYNVLVRVDVPDDAPVGQVGHVTVTVESENDDQLTDTAADEALVAIVRTYKDPTHSTNIVEARPCSTVHALASGLQGNQSGFRFVWRDGTGISRQISETATDSEGTCRDSFQLEDLDLGPDWSVEIREWDGFDYDLQDTATYSIAEASHIANLELAESPLAHVGSDLSASVDLVNDSAFQQLDDLRIRWLVLSPNDLMYLTASGVCAPYTGVESTRVTSTAVGAGSTVSVDMSVSNISFPMVGTYRVEAEQLSDCSVGAPALTAVFTVIDDEDGDGATTADELLAGTDPADADSDDDGLLDAEDGFGDSDGDGLIDALDCDSDGDGLPDGLEAGVFSAHADTNPSAGCLQLDVWPASTTDPDLADTDGGGVPDGAEDRNGDGRVGLDETDPNDPVDDVESDTDGDGLTNLEEQSLLTDPLDADSDDDGLLDNEELFLDTDADGLIDALDCDSDNDALPDGLESGLSAAAHEDTDLTEGCFRPDAEPRTTTSPLLSDSDGGGVPDGIEDANRDGRRDAGEGDPMDPADDSNTCSFDVPGELALWVARLGTDSQLTWTEILDPCTTQEVLSAETPDDLASLSAGHEGSSFLDTRLVGPGGVHFYRVRSVSSVGGVGP